VVKIQSGFCPELGKRVSIKVELEELHLSGELSPAYRAKGYDCEHSALNGCEASGEYGAECPLFKACCQ